MRIVAILEVQWGIPGDARRWFRINPNNFSGRRLISLIGHRDFLVTNACPECVGSPSERGTPNPLWLRDNLAELQPDVVLVCGAVARKTFSPTMVGESCKIIHMPHPAARMRREMMEELRAEIAAAISN